MFWNESVRGKAKVSVIFNRKGVLKQRCRFFRSNDLEVICHAHDC